MIAIVNFQFHDSEPEMFVMDTNKLGDTPFENDLKKALEGSATFKELIGSKYNDEWGAYRDAVIEMPLSNQTSPF